MQVNSDPSLSTDTRVDLDVKAAVLVDLLNVVGVGAIPPGVGPEETAAKCAAAAAVGSVAERVGATEHGGAQSLRQEVLRCVNDELRRAATTGWRRLHPVEGGAYHAFLDLREPLHTLSYEA